MRHIFYFLSVALARNFISQLFWAQYTVYIWRDQLGAHCPLLSFADFCSISTTLSSFSFLYQQFLAIWPYFPYMKYILFPPLPLFTFIVLGSLTGPGCLPLFWYPPLYWSSSLYMICSPLLLYDPPPNPPLGYVFPCGYIVFLPNIRSSALLYLWFLSSLTALSCHSSIVLGGLSASANFFLISPFSPLLNSSMRGHPLYLFSLAIFLNSWTYSLHILPSFSIILSCSTFLSSSAVSPICFSFCWIIPLPFLFLTLSLIAYLANCPSILLLLPSVYKIAPRPSSLPLTPLSSLYWSTSELC